MTTADAASPTEELDQDALAFLNHFGINEDGSEKKKGPPSAEGGEDPQPKPEAETEEETSEETLEETTEDKGDEEKPEEKAEAKAFVEDEKAYVKVKVGEEEHDVPVTQLKRLFGQEAALTQRSQQLAEQRRTAEAEQSKTAAVLSVMVQRARERVKPFQNFNIVDAVQKGMPAEELQYVQQAAKEAYDELRFVETEATAFQQRLQEHQAKAIEAAAEKAWDQLSDPADPHHVEGWSDETYNQIIDFGVKNGLNKQMLEQVTDAPVFKLMHQAMMYQKGLSKVITTKKTDKSPKKIVKTTRPPSVKTVDEDKIKQAAKRLRETGSEADAAELFLARHTASLQSE